MFTGIIESVGRLEELVTEGANIEMVFSSPISRFLIESQSLSHNGVCLTITRSNENRHSVIAVKETLEKSNLGGLKQGDMVNLERCMSADGRFDGHIVQGHVDGLGGCVGIEEQSGSWYFTFSFDKAFEGLIVSKGSICINGVSLTVANLSQGLFSVAVIPYTFHHTTFHSLKVGDTVNLEFDIVGKYIQRMYQLSRG